MSVCALLQDHGKPFETSTSALKARVVTPARPVHGAAVVSFSLVCGCGCMGGCGVRARVCCVPPFVDVRSMVWLPVSSSETVGAILST